MSLRLASWLPQAEALPLGGRARCGHDCGPGQVLIVNHTDTGWSGYCFRCDEKGFKPKPLPSLQERLAQRDACNAAERALERDPSPPQPAVFDTAQWPLEARVWLYKAALTTEDIAALGFYYHPPTKRVVIPVLDKGELIYWQARRIFGDAGPKYLNSPVGRDGCVAKHGTGPEIVLTEDVLSAARVGMATEAWAIIGTSLPASKLNALMADGRPVFVWLDDDPTPRNSGQKAAAKIMRTLELAGVPCINIKTPKDPKFNTREQVRQEIAKARLALKQKQSATKMDTERCGAQSLSDQSQNIDWCT